jgi:hypothetical protein
MHPRREEAYVRTRRMQEVRVREYCVEKVDVATAMTCERDVRNLEVSEKRWYNFCLCISAECRRVFEMHTLTKPCWYPFM